MRVFWGAIAASIIWTIALYLPDVILKTFLLVIMTVILILMLDIKT